MRVKYRCCIWSENIVWGHSYSQVSSTVSVHQLLSVSHWLLRFQYNCHQFCYDPFVRRNFTWNKLWWTMFPRVLFSSCQLSWICHQADPSLCRSWNTWRCCRLRTSSRTLRSCLPACPCCWSLQYPAASCRPSKSCGSLSTRWCPAGTVYTCVQALHTAALIHHHVYSQRRRQQMQHNTQIHNTQKNKQPLWSK